MLDTRLVKVELRRILKERVILVGIALLSLLTAYGAWDSSRWTGEQASIAESLAQKQTEALSERSAKVANERPPLPGEAPAPSAGDAFSIGATLHYVSLPFIGTAVTSLGQMDVLDPRVGVSLLNSTRTDADKDGLENPWALFSGRIDVAFVVIYLMPLLILALGFSLISSEREGGTLQIILSNPISLSTFSLSKALAHSLVAITAILLVMPIAVLLGGGDLTVDVAVRWLLWSAVVVVYAVFWTGVVLLVASLRKDSATGALYCLAIWLGLVIVIPSLMSSLVSIVSPVPSRIELISQIRAINPDMRKEAEALIGEFYKDHPEYLPADGTIDSKNRRLASVQVQLNQKAKIEEFERRHRQQVSSQQGIVRYLGFLSPPVITHDLFGDIAGTGTARHSHFTAQASAHAAEWDEFFIKRISSGRSLTVAEFEEIPTFEYREESLSSVLWRVIPGILILCVLTAGLVLVSVRRLSRSQVLD